MPTYDFVCRECNKKFHVTCHVEEYQQGLIKKHENTIQKKEDDRTRHVATLKANAGPVFLTYRDQAAIDRPEEGSWSTEARPSLVSTSGSGAARCKRIGRTRLHDPTGSESSMMPVMNS